jgi:hypothetical protein
MATSGTTSYSVNELDILKGALGKIGVLESGQPLNADDVVVLRRNLNMIVKQWVAQTDFAPGLKMWTRRRAFLFLQDEQIQYSIGPTGDECASEEYVTTTLSTSLVGTSAVVTSATDLVADMRIGIVDTSGALVWTTISSVVGTTVALGTSVTADAGATVFAYTSKPFRPFEIISGSLRDQEGQDSPIDVNLSIDEYELIPTKRATGTPSRLYFEARTGNARVYLDRSPDDLSKVLRLVYHSYIEDTTAQTDDVDFPAEWFRALVGQLAMDSALDFSRPITPDLEKFAKEGLAMAKNAYPSKSTAYYQSEPDDY